MLRWSSTTTSSEYNKVYISYHSFVVYEWATWGRILQSVDNKGLVLLSVDNSTCFLLNKKLKKWQLLSVDYNKIRHLSVHKNTFGHQNMSVDNNIFGHWYLSVDNNIWGSSVNRNKPHYTHRYYIDILISSNN